MPVAVIFQEFLSVLDWKTKAETHEAEQLLRLAHVRGGFRHLDEFLVLKILSYLPLFDLIRASQVSRRWYRISFDKLLWKNVDLRRFTKLPDSEDVFERLTEGRLADKIHNLDLSGLVLTEKNLNAIAVRCKNLRSLTLKCVTFKSNDSQDIKNTQLVVIPKHLERLDIRFSRGSHWFFISIASQLGSVKCLGLCDGFLRALRVSGKLESTIASMTDSLENLDLSHCLFVTDSLLALFARCAKLKLLSLRKCIGVWGNSLDLFLKNCPYLKTLVLDGTSIEEKSLENMQWQKSFLKSVELGWCPLLTSKSLKTTLPRIAQISSLEYLGLCDVGQGKALTDDLLVDFAVSLSSGPCRSLKCVYVGSCQRITNVGLERFRKCYPFIEALDMTYCAAKSQVTTTKLDANQNKWSISGHKVELVQTRPGSWCAEHFSLSRYALETPL